MSRYTKILSNLQTIIPVLALFILAGCTSRIPAVSTSLPPKEATDSPAVPTATLSGEMTTDRPPESPLCQQEYEQHELKIAYPPKGDHPRTTLSKEEFLAVLGQIGIESICIPVEWGAPFIQADWNSAEGTAQTGRMLSIGFEALYEGAGWSDAALVYATYDFAAGTEYDTFATRGDLEALQVGSIPSVLSVDGVEGFSRPFASIPMGMQWVWNTVVYPFEDDYFVIALRLGAFDPATIDDTLLEVREGQYPVERQSDVKRMQTLVSSIQFSSSDESSLTINLVSDFTNPREVDESNLENLGLQHPPLISETDIVHYDLLTHEIELTEEAFERLMSLFTLPIDTDGIPFVVVVSGEPIYSGAFYTPASSVSYSGVVILQPFPGETNMISIQVGYPGLEAFLGEDPRSDPRIISAIQELQR